MLTRELCCIGGSRGHTVHYDIRNALLRKRKRDISVSKKLGEGSLLQTEATGRKSGCRTRPTNSHGSSGFLKYQKPGACNCHNDWQGQKGSRGGLISRKV